MTQGQSSLRLHLTACGTLAADWRPGSQGVGDAGRAPQLPAVGPNEE
jgi:hypothetical protein